MLNLYTYRRNWNTKYQHYKSPDIQYYAIAFSVNLLKSRTALIVALSVAINQLFRTAANCWI